MNLPSLDEVFAIAILVVPGFFAFLIFKNLVPNRRSKFSDYEMTIYSLIYALPILSTYYLLTGTGEITDLVNDIFQLSNLTILALLTIGWGLIPGIIAKFTFARGQTVGNCWDEFEKGFDAGADLLVYTEDGREWRGWIKRYDCTEDKQELILGDPELIIRNEKMKILKEIKMGQEMLFAEKGIISISRLTPSKGRTKDADTLSGKGIMNAAKNEVDKIFEFCLLLITVLAAAILQFATYLYPLGTDPQSLEYIHNLESVNLVFRITTISIILLVVTWITVKIVPTPREEFTVDWFKRRFVKEFCWCLFGNSFVLLVMFFINLSFSNSVYDVVLTSEYATLFSVILAFPSTWYYVNNDKQIACETEQKHLKWRILLEHAVIYLISYCVLRVLLYISGTFPSPTPL